MQKSKGKNQKSKTKRLNTHCIKLNLEGQRSHYSLVLHLCTVGIKKRLFFFYSKSLILRASILKIMCFPLNFLLLPFGFTLLHFGFTLLFYAMGLGGEGRLLAETILQIRARHHGVSAGGASPDSCIKRLRSSFSASSSRP